jgi:hypothetical protein
MSKYLITLEVEGDQAFNEIVNNIYDEYKVIHTEEIEGE